MSGGTNKHIAILAQLTVKEFSASLCHNQTVLQRVFQVHNMKTHSSMGETISFSFIENVSRTNKYCSFKTSCHNRPAFQGGIPSPQNEDPPIWVKHLFDFSQTKSGTSKLLI